MHFSRLTLLLGVPVLVLANDLNTICTGFHLDESLSYVLRALCVSDTGQNISLLDLDACIANDGGQLVVRDRLLVPSLLNAELMDS